MDITLWIEVALFIILIGNEFVIVDESSGLRHGASRKSGCTGRVSGKQ